MAGSLSIVPPTLKTKGLETGEVKSTHPFLVEAREIDHDSCRWTESRNHLDIHHYFDGRVQFIRLVVRRQLLYLLQCESRGIDRHGDHVRHWALLFGAEGVQIVGKVAASELRNSDGLSLALSQREARARFEVGRSERR